MADVSSLVRKVEDRSRFIAMRTAIDIEKELRSSALRHGHGGTGKMISKIKVTPSHQSPTLWRITADVPVIQAATTSHGARKHTLQRGKFYAWTTPGGKRVVTTPGGKRVVVRWTKNPIEHPGNKASHWFEEVVSPVAIRGILTRFVGR